MSEHLADLHNKVRALRDALSVALVMAEELSDALERNDHRAVPATDEQRRQVAALRRLLDQPKIDGVAITGEQAAHEIAYWTAEAARRPAGLDRTRQIDEMIAALVLDGVPVQRTETLSLADFVRLMRRLKALQAEHAAAGARK